MDLQLFGDRLRKARERLALTQEELAIRLGKNQNAISAYEKGRRAIRITELPRLAETLKVPIAYFFVEEYPIYDEHLISLLRQIPLERREEIIARLQFELEYLTTNH